MAQVVVSGLGAVAGDAESAEEVFDKLCNSRGWLSQHTHHHDGHRSEVYVGRTDVESRSMDTARFDLNRALSRAERMLHSAVSQAWERSAIGTDDYEPSRIGVYVGSCSGGWDDRTNSQACRSDGAPPVVFQEFADLAALEIGAQGPRVVTSVACSSAAHAVAIAYDSLVEGSIDVALCAGVDQLVGFTLVAFDRLGTLDAGPTQPFGRSSGTNLGEAAGALVLERSDRASSRGADVHAAMLGYGLSADAHSPLQPEPEGLGIERAVRAALSCAAISYDQVDYINGHGTGSTASDAAEMRVFERLAGAGAGPWVGSTKGATGHALGGTSALELVLSALAIQRQRLPPNQGGGRGRPDHPNVRILERPTTTVVQRTMSLSSAFGGHNSAVLFGRQDVANEFSRPASDAVVIAGIGPIGLPGTGAEAWTALPRRSKRTPEETGDEVTIRPDSVKPRHWRRMDHYSRLVVTAAELALADAALGLSAGSDVGVVVASDSSSVESGLELNRRIRNGDRWDPSMFANSVCCAASAHLSIVHGWTGPTMTLNSGWAVGSHALVVARQMLLADRVRAVVIANLDTVRQNPDYSLYDQHVARSDLGSSQALAVCAVGLVVTKADHPGVRPRLELSDIESRGAAHPAWLVDDLHQHWEPMLGAMDDIQRVLVPFSAESANGRAITAAMDRYHPEGEIVDMTTSVGLIRGAAMGAGCALLGLDVAQAGKDSVIVLGGPGGSYSSVRVRPVLRTAQLQD